MTLNNLSAHKEEQFVLTEVVSFHLAVRNKKKKKKTQPRVGNQFRLFRQKLLWIFEIRV